jgi:predicted SprT family Zn-dependent metalloprotease
MAGDARYAIGLAPDYYYQKGIDNLLEVVRHELIHQWQYQHPDGGRGGHGPKFRQWVDDLDTERYCKHWSKS